MSGAVQRRGDRRWGGVGRWVAGLAVAVAVAACGHLASERPDLVAAHPAPPVVASLPRLAPLPEGVPLDAAQVARLAVARNRALRALRARHGVAAAQLVGAGLLPDPELTLDGDHPTSGDGSEVNAWSATLVYPVGPVVTRGRRRAAAAARLRRVDLEVAWQEWQVAAEARSLFVTAATATRRLHLLRQAASEVDALYRRASDALAGGRLGVTPVADELAATLKLEARRDRAARELADAQARLRTLLDLEAATPLPLADAPLPAPPSETAVAAALDEVKGRRPDLRALAAGRSAATARERAALLSRFPAVAIELHTGRETDATESVGGGITLRLPLLNRRRGAIATARAEQGRLAAEVTARLSATRHDAARLMRRAALIDAELTRLDRRAAAVATLATRARAAFARHRLAPRAYLAAERARLDLHLRQLRLAGDRAQTAITLDTLLARPVEAYRESR